MFNSLKGKKGFPHRDLVCLIALQGEKDFHEGFSVFNSLTRRQGLPHMDPTYLIAL